jgi:carbamoyltransferase
MIVAGVSAFFHDAACCLMRDGQIVAAVQEERLSRVKYDPRLPVESWRYCLAEAGLHPGEVDALAYYEIPEERAARQRAMGLEPGGDDPIETLRQRLGFDGPIRCHAHHASHAAAAYLLSPHDEAAVLTVDAVGEWDSTTWWHGCGHRLTRLGGVAFPDSLGLLYASITSWLGFAVNGGEGKVMGLAAHGEPSLMGAVRQLIADDRPERFALRHDHFDFGGARLFASGSFRRLFGPQRMPDDPLEPRHANIAASLQRVTEDLLLAYSEMLHARTGLRRLCLGGGVALNCLANGRLSRESPFDSVWVQPAAGDAGSALGAAALEHARLTDERPAPLAHVYLGPRFDVREHLEATPVTIDDFGERPEALLDEVVERLARGEVLGWFQGRMEFGPRALGARSILADPRQLPMRDRVNADIKRREVFRPFAPSILPDDLATCFGDVAEAPFMTFAHPVVDSSFPAATHVDGTARLHVVDPVAAPRLSALLVRWRERTGCPALLNTSFNVRGEPIVCTPSDALKSATDAGLDAVVFDDLLVHGFPEGWRERFLHRPVRAVLDRNLYTF